MTYSTLKRVFDFNLAIFGLILFSPLIIIITISILLDDGLPAIYHKKSLGLDGRVFDAFKFRSMKVNSSAVTKAGRLFRGIAMDELPQLVNIAKGEMSFVGPRNYGIIKYGVPNDFNGKKIIPQDLSLNMVNFSKRLQVTPGLTGMAQIFAPKHAGDEEVLKWDLQYIKRKNFILDLYIIFISIWITVRKKWEETTVKF